MIYEEQILFFPNKICIPVKKFLSESDIRNLSGYPLKHLPFYFTISFRHSSRNYFRVCSKYFFQDFYRNSFQNYSKNAFWGSFKNCSFLASPGTPPGNPSKILKNSRTFSVIPPGIAFGIPSGTASGFLQEFIQDSLRNSLLDSSRYSSRNSCRSF